MKHYGDITKIDGSKVESVNVICGGSPCQDLSVAGKRAGLAGQRSGLYMEQIRIVKEMRDESKKRYADSGSDVDIRHISPRYMVWENVPGAFSSNKGEDFRAVLEEAAKVIERDAVIPGPPNGKWPSAGLILFDHGSIAWRQHDAQFWGVPQRRKRICMLCDFNGQTAGEILFECWRETKDSDSVETVTDLGAKSESEVQSVSESLPGNTGESGKARESTPGTTENGIRETSYTLKVRGGREFDSAGKRAGKGALVQTELSGTLGVSQDQTLIRMGQCLNGWDVQSKHIQPMDGKAEALYSGECRGGGGESYVLQNQKAIGFNGWQSITAKMPTLEEKMPPIEATMPPNVMTFEPGATSRIGGHFYDDDVAGTVRANAGDNQQAVVYGISSNDSNAMKSSNPHSGIYEAETTRTLDNNGGNPACNQGGMVVLEGNGSRPSHKGDGYAEGEISYTLNSTEQHSVCYRSVEDGENKVNAFDNYNMALTGEVAKTLQSEGGGSGVKEGCVLIENHPNDSRVQLSKDGMVQTLSGRMGTGGGNVPMVMKTIGLDNHNIQIDENVSETLRAESHGALPMVMETYQDTTGALCASGYDKLGTQEAANDMFVVQKVSSWDRSQIAPTLTKNNANGAQRMPDKDNFNAVVQSIETFHCTTEEDKVQTLKARDYKDPQVVSYGLDRAAYNQGKNAKFDFSVEQEKIGAETSRGPGAVCETYQNVTETMCASISKGTSNQLATDDMFVANVSVVRRLTPLECTRLQNFPDGWVDIGDWVDTKGKLHKDSDSNKYKALGNSIALPFWIWLAERICNQLRKDGDDQISMASLFDGIGGFPLSFSKFGAKPIWASEIEEYPIAVTKKRFPEA